MAVQPGLCRTRSKTPKTVFSQRDTFQSNGTTYSRGIGYHLNSLPTGYFSMLFCRLLMFFKINFLKKFFQEYHQNVKQSNESLGLILVQTVCQSYQQTTLVDKKLTKYKYSIVERSVRSSLAEVSDLGQKYTSDGTSEKKKLFLKKKSADDKKACKITQHVMS